MSSITQTAALAAPTAGCPPHAWITLRTTTSCSRCGLIRAAAEVSGRSLPVPPALATDPDLVAVLLPGETVEERAARIAALADIAEESGDYLAAIIARSSDVWLYEPYEPSADELDAVGGWAA